MQYSLHKESDASKKAYPNLACVDCVKLRKSESSEAGVKNILQFPKWYKPSVSTQVKGGDICKEGKETTSLVTREQNVAVRDSPSFVRKSVRIQTEAITNFGGKAGCGKSEISTPTKLKLLENKPVTKLVPVFDNPNILPAFSPGVGDPGSKTKKRKLEQ